MLDFPRWKTLSILAACLFFVLAALPNVLSPSARESWPDWLPQQTVNLGLDLRGGSHLLLQMDFDTYLDEHFDMLRAEVRNVLREANIGYLDLRRDGQAVTFRIRQETVEEDTDIRKLLRDISDDIEISEDEGAYRIDYTDAKLREMKLQLLEQSIEIVNRRINETGTKEPTIQRQGDNRIVVQVPGVEDPEQLKNILGETAKMNFHLLNESVTPSQLKSGLVPPGTRLLPSDDSAELFPDGSPMRYAVYSRVALSGELLTDASATYDRGQPIVQFQFNSLGARKFGEITQQNVGKRFAVVLDGKVITAPVIRTAILGGSGIIEGNFTVDSANNLAILLRAGALPAPLKIVEERSVGPSLGADSIAAGEMAALIAIVTVIIYMFVSYGLFGVISNIALVMNLIIIMGVLSLLQATLTLPGIAGIVLTLGMAVDANVLIFERIREEVRTGKTALAAVSSGFKAAFNTIIDSNITTLIAAVVLFYFGTGTVRGFAVTLSIGILSSMFSAILLTRMMVAHYMKSQRPKVVPV